MMTTPADRPGPARTTSGGRAEWVRRAFSRWAERIDRSRGWDRLPRSLGLAVLFVLRDQMRRHNLVDTDTIPSVPRPASYPPAGYLRWRTVDGTYNELTDPEAGSVGTRFGRNLDLTHVAATDDATLLTPDPRVVSRRLLTRRHFQPATSVNLLAAAWIQFMVKDWMSHGEGDPGRAFHLPVGPGDAWPQSEILVPRTLPDPTRLAPGASPPTFVNTCSHWWDLSSIYGTSAEEQRAIRTFSQGRLRLSADGHLALPAEGSAGDPTTVPGFWVGLALMATLFVREHNAICSALLTADPSMDDEETFQRARLVNAALVAKIHTVEWTPAMIAHPTTVTGMRASWYGLVGERLGVPLSRLLRSEILTGIPGSRVRDFDVRYSLTEEFVAVYRMHPLIPDHYTLLACDTGEVLEEPIFRDLAGPEARRVLARHSMTDLLYSFGVAHPGEMTLHNYPRFLQEFIRPDQGGITDLAATDLLRTREAGIPRYNEFRRALRLAPAADFEDLSGDREAASVLREVYGDVEQVDLMVGMLAERKPRGFAFSDTAFRIFLLMASRRLNSDRFFTNDYKKATYTMVGLDWIRRTTMRDVLVRHYPSLRMVGGGTSNAFAPWSRP
jgi:hypothetical protein